MALLRIMLGLALQNRKPQGEAASEIFASRAGDAEFQVLLTQISEHIPTDVVGTTYREMFEQDWDDNKDLSEFSLGEASAVMHRRYPCTISVTEGVRFVQCLPRDDPDLHADPDAYYAIVMATFRDTHFCRVYPKSEKLIRALLQSKMTSGEV